MTIMVRRLYNNKNCIVVAVSGFFSILHGGHIELFKAAFELGRRLLIRKPELDCHKIIVILNSDEQLLRKKTTPLIMNAIERRKIIESIRYVDEVVDCIDKDDSVAETLKIVRPDVFLNSGDRPPSKYNSKEQQVCELLGIQQEYIQMPKENSSRFIVEKCRAWNGL